MERLRLMSSLFYMGAFFKVVERRGMCDDHFADSVGYGLQGVLYFRKHASAYGSVGLESFKQGRVDGGYYR